MKKYFKGKKNLKKNNCWQKKCWQKKSAIEAEEKITADKKSRSTLRTKKLNQEVGKWNKATRY